MAGANENKVLDDSFFNVEVVYESFYKSLLPDGDVEMDSYLIAYKELYKLFQKLGTVCWFVGFYVESDIEILEDYRRGKTSSKYFSLKTMIKSDVDGHLIQRRTFESGSRLFLRLHRSLDFIRIFLAKMCRLRDREKTTAVCLEAYAGTLAKRDSVLVRREAAAAMDTLPNRSRLLQKVCGTPEKIEKYLIVLPKLLGVTFQVFLRTENIYREYKLHNLP